MLILSILALCFAIEATPTPQDGIVFQYVDVFLLPGENQLLWLPVPPDNKFHSPNDLGCYLMSGGPDTFKTRYDCFNTKIEHLFYNVGGPCKTIDGAGTTHSFGSKEVYTNDLGDSMVRAVCCGPRCPDH